MSHPEAPHGPPFDGQKETTAPPSPEAVAGHAGSAAVSSETTNGQDIGQVTLGQIRSMFREGTLNAEGGTSSPAITREHPAEHKKMGWAMEDWRARYPPDDTVADEVARRMRRTWAKTAAVQRDPQFMADGERLSHTLSAFYEDAKHAAVDLGLPVSVALYNTRAELDAARQLVERSPHLSTSDLAECAKLSRQNILSAATRAQDNVEAIITAEREGKILPHTAPLRKAMVVRTAVRGKSAKECVDTINDHLETVDQLAAKYAEHPLVRPSQVKDVCIGNTTNPEATIQAKLAMADKMITRFEGVHGLTKADIAQVVFENRRPQKKLQDVVDAIPNVGAQLGNRLSEAALRRLVLGNSDPVNEGQGILKRADGLKTALAGDAAVQKVFRNDSDYIDAVSRYGANPDKAARFAHRVVAGRAHFRENPRVTDAIIRKASADPGDVIRNTTDLLSEASRLTSLHARQDVPASVIERAVTGSNDSGEYIRGFLGHRDDAKRQFGTTLPQSVVNEICRSNTDPLDVLGRQAAVYNRERLDPANAELTNEEVVRRVVSQPLDVDVKPYNAPTILQDMQRFSRERPNSGSRMHIDARYIPHVEEVVGRAREWANEFLPPDSGVDPELAASRFGRMYYTYIRHGDDVSITSDPQMLRAVFEDFCDQAMEIHKAGYTNPAAVVQFNPSRKVLNQPPEQAAVSREAARMGTYANSSPIRRLSGQLRDRYEGGTDDEFIDRLEALTEEERELLRRRIAGEADDDLQEALGSEDLDDRHKGLLEYLRLRTRESNTTDPSVPTYRPPRPQPQGPSQPPRASTFSDQGANPSVRGVQTELQGSIEALHIAAEIIAQGITKFQEATQNLRTAVAFAPDAATLVERDAVGAYYDIIDAERALPDRQGTTPEIEALYAQKKVLDDLAESLRNTERLVTALMRAGDALQHAEYSYAIMEEVSGTQIPTYHANM